LKEEKKRNILITGGAGFIGSNLCGHFLSKGHHVRCLDNFSTGMRSNVQPFLSYDNFELIEGDIRSIDTCQDACKGIDFVLHQAALGSITRSINDPITTNQVNVDGFLNMLNSARDNGVFRFIYAGSSSTYGDSKKLPKIEDEIGKPRSPYAVTKYVNELYAEIYSKTYKMQCIGLRYFNVFGKNQTPEGEYAAVIPLWLKELINHESPTINGDGFHSRDFTYIDNVIEANERAMLISTEAIFHGQQNYYNLNHKRDALKKEITTSHQGLSGEINEESFSEVFNVACGERMSLIELFYTLRKELAHYDKNIETIEPVLAENRLGDIPHSQASIVKAKMVLGYEAKFKVKRGLKEVCNWYFTQRQNINL
jgi:UDP-N-acetylglucosamine 4-epimerase